MHLWKMSKKEISNNMSLCLFIMIQSMVVMAAILFVVSVFTTRYEKYKAVHDMVGDDGLILNAEYLVKAGENPENYNCGCADDVEELFPGTKAVCSYIVWTVYDYKDVWTQYEPKTIAYDSEAAFSYAPAIEDGRWLKKDDLDTTEIEAVITPNTFGIKTGDELTITTNSIGEPLAAPLTVRIVGVTEDNTDIMGAPAGGAEIYHDVRDSFFTYSSKFSEVPILMYIQSDLRNAENAVLGKPCITTLLMGMQFISFNDDITDSERENINNCILSGKCQLNNIIEMKDFKKNSKAVIWSQLNEIIPVFTGLLILVLMSVICAGAMMTRAQLKNYAIYYIVGLKWKDCVRLQIMEQTVMQGITLIITLAGLAVLRATGMLDNTLLRMGVPQAAACTVYAAVCVLVSAILPVRIINRNTPKSILTSGKE